MKKKKIYRFKGTEGGAVSAADAKKWIQAHQDHHEVKGHFFGKEILQKMLEKPGAVGIRIYHAIGDDTTKRLVLLPVDSKGNDMWGSKPAGKFGAKNDPDGPVDQGAPCPPFCSTT